MEDNFYLTSTERLIKPSAKQKEKFLHDKLIFEKERPLVTAVIKILKEEIKYRERVDSVTEISDPEKCMRQIDVNRQVCNILRPKVAALERKVRMYDSKELK